MLGVSPGAGMKRKLVFEVAPEAAANAIEGPLASRAHGALAT